MSIKDKIFNVAMPILRTIPKLKDLDFSNKLGGLSFSKETFFSNLNKHDEKWYFSSEGKNAYEGLTSISDKTRFFWIYLKSIGPCAAGKFVSNVDYFSSYIPLYRIAYIMASTMVDSKLEFGGYPNILDEEKNPFISVVKNEIGAYKIFIPGSQWTDYDIAICQKLLDALSGKYEGAFFYDASEPTSDIYKIQRDILFLFDYSCRGEWRTHREYKIMYTYEKKLDIPAYLNEEVK